ncbi:MAG: hypothetical protein SFU86_20095 [Pirellulaceae bacterium]|nr:hypothetical protein [Pirellulaceae bacterium]
MAKQGDLPQGSWLLAEELLEWGDSAFVDELRRISDADKLGAFAAKWLADTRPASRRLLLEYLGRPLNAFRHEALVKRLFKLAEKAADDQIMGRMLVACDRAVRRIRRKQTRFDWNTRESWVEETIVTPRHSTLPKDPRAFVFRNPRTGERIAAPTAEKHDNLRLFSIHTRNYLRRRAWRYFRHLGKQQPDRYLRAVAELLALYTDADVADGLALLDKWGLVQILFRHSPAIIPSGSGWKLANGHTLAELAAAASFADVWKTSPVPLLALLKTARCRPVRQWTLQMLRTHHPSALGSLPLGELIALIGHEDAEVAELAIAGLRNSPSLGLLTIEQWLALLEAVNPQALEPLCELVVQRLDGGAVSFGQAVKLSASRPLPVARLGLSWLKTKQPASEAECRQLLSLAEAEAEPVRGEAIRWLREVLGASPHFEAGWILELLDSRHDDVRREAWGWFLAESRASGDVSLWQKLLESPYDDVRLPLVEYLEAGTRHRELATLDRSQFDPALVRFLWAAVLLNIHRGGRAKPRVVGQIVNRLARQPAEASQLLPILSVALRSIRGPEFRAGLAGVVQLLDRAPELASAVRLAFPELALN